MKKPNVVTATKEQIDRYIKYLIRLDPVLKESNIVVSFKDKKSEGKNNAQCNR